MSKKEKSKDKKVFVLDTSVILFEHNSILNFDEHDIGIPITVLEELDNFKKGNDTKNFEAREIIRFIDKISGSNLLRDWIPINGKGKGMNLVAEDYQTGKIKDLDGLYTGKTTLENVNPLIINKIYEEGFCELKK